MPTPVKMPRLGESVAEGTIGAWLKQEGDYVEKDEALAEIVTDKINAELPSPIAGRLTKIIVHVDQTVPVDADIAFIEEDQADALENKVSPSSEANGSSELKVSSLVSVSSPHAPEKIATLTSLNNAAGRLDHVHQQIQAAEHNSVQEQQHERQRISPLARRLAKEHRIDLNAIAGTGAHGRVRKEDILAYVEQGATIKSVPADQVTTSAIAHQISQAPEVITPIIAGQSLTAAADEEVIVPSRMRMAIAEHMVRSKHTSPHATTVVEVDMTNIAKWLEKNKEEFKRREGYAISFVPFVMKAVCEGIRQFPLINSTWTPDNKIIIKKRIHLGLAIATETGLVVPTVHDANQYTLAGLAKQVSTLAQKARSNKLAIQDMQGSTFVVNNPGVFGTIISMPIINQPHAAILSMDAVVKRAVVIEDDAIAVRSMMYLCLSFDHRILDGAGAAGFLQAVRKKLQSYSREIDVY